MEYVYEENSVIYREFEKYYQGARDMMIFMHDYYDGKEPIYPSEMEEIFIKFAEQFCTVKTIEKMSRRYCDRYVCKECPFYTDKTDNLKVAMSEHSFDEIKKFLLNTYDSLTNLEINVNGKYKKEYCCMMHYYNPDGIYDE